MIEKLLKNKLVLVLSTSNVLTIKICSPLWGEKQSLNKKELLFSNSSNSFVEQIYSWMIHPFFLNLLLKTVFGSRIKKFIPIVFPIFPFIFPKLNFLLSYLHSNVIKNFAVNLGQTLVSFKVNWIKKIKKIGWKKLRWKVQHENAPLNKIFLGSFMS